jgi:Ca-activated chloride channel family protein
MRAGKAMAPAGATLGLDEVRALAATEAGRLRDAAARPAAERRDLLDDLASRLHVLVGALPGEAFTPLRDLVATLRGDAPLADRWAAALDVLSRFAGDAKPASAGSAPTVTPPPLPEPAPDRKAFWKR